MLVGSLRVAAGSVLGGVALGDLDARIRVVTLTRADGRGETMPRRDTRLAAGDRAFLIGPDEELLTLLGDRFRALPQIRLGNFQLPDRNGRPVRLGEMRRCACRSSPNPARSGRHPQNRPRSRRPEATDQRVRCTRVSSQTGSSLA